MNAAVHSRAARAYGEVGVRSGVGAADPHKLVLMLFEGAGEALRRARGHMEAGRPGPGSEAIAFAVQIVQEGLKAALDPARGGPMAGQLSDLYDYITRRLLTASARNDGAALDEAVRLLHDLHEAWARIAPTGR